MNEDGLVTIRGSLPADYGTDVLAAEAQKFLASDVAIDPFLLQISGRAPHGVATPADRHLGLFRDVYYPRSPNFNEADVTDKPREISRLKRVTPEMADIAPDLVDGRSFLPIVIGDDISWRTSYLLGRGGATLKGMVGLRTEQYMYVEYNSGEREFYDPSLDPWQLDNACATMAPELQVALHDRVEVMRTCTGETCRTTEGLPLLPPPP